MNRNPNRRPVCVGRWIPNPALAVWLGLSVMLGSNGYAQDHAATPAASTLLPGGTRHQRRFDRRPDPLREPGPE